MLESFQVRLRCPKGLSEGVAARAGGNVAPGGPLSMLFFFRLEPVLRMHVMLSLNRKRLSHASTHKHAALVSVCHVRGRVPGAGSPDGAATHCSQPLSWAAACKQRTSSRHTLACGTTVKMQLRHFPGQKAQHAAQASARGCHTSRTASASAPCPLPRGGGWRPPCRWAGGSARAGTRRAPRWPTAERHRQTRQACNHVLRGVTAGLFRRPRNSVRPARACMRGACN